MKDNFKLPNGWVATTFGAIVSSVSVNDKKLPKGEYLQAGRFPVVDQGQHFIGGYSNDETKVITEDLPVLVFGDHTRAFKYLDQPFVPGADGIKVLKPSGVNAKWLYQIAHVLEFPDKGYARHYQHLKTAQIFVPPLPEQRRIVAEIEKQFSRLEEGVTALKRVQANLKRYRAAVLKAACEGRLVENEVKSQKLKGKSVETGEQLLKRILEERRKNWSGRGKYKEPDAPDTTNLPSLPEGWTWASLEQLATHITDGTHKTPTYVEKGIPFLSAKDISGFKVSFDACRYITKSEHEELTARCKVVRGNVLITKSGTIGRVAVVETDMEFSLFESVANVPVLPPIESKFLSIASFFAISGVFGAANQKGVAVRHLHLEDLRRVPIPLPPLAEQKRIVEEVERRLSVIDELESLVTTNLQRATRLRQAVLQKAFEGKLVV